MITSIYHDFKLEEYELKRNGNIIAKEIVTILENLPENGGRAGFIITLMSEFLVFGKKIFNNI